MEILLDEVYTIHAEDSKTNIFIPFQDEDKLDP
jgi:hypothetical protein